MSRAPMARNSGGMTPRAPRKAFGHEAAEAGEHQHAGDQHRGRYRGIGQRQHGVGDEADLDHDVAQAQAGEVKDAEQQARRAAGEAAPAEHHRDGDQHQPGEGRRWPAWPTAADSPIPAAAQTVGDARQVARTQVGGEMGVGIWSAGACRRRSAAPCRPRCRALSAWISACQAARAGWWPAPCRHRAPRRWGRRWARWGRWPRRPVRASAGAAVTGRAWDATAFGAALAEQLFAVAIQHPVCRVRRTRSRAGRSRRRTWPRCARAAQPRGGVETAALVQDGRGGQVAGGDEEAVGQFRLARIARRRDRGGVKLEHRLRRLFLVPQGHRQHAAGLERAHVAMASRACRRTSPRWRNRRDWTGRPNRPATGRSRRSAGRCGRGTGAVVIHHADLWIGQHVAGEDASAWDRGGRRQKRRDCSRPR